MNKALFFLALLSLSCRRNPEGNSTAQQICDCYESIHSKKETADNEEELQREIDKCNQLFQSELERLKNKPEEKRLFMKAYRNCQEK